MSQLGKPALKKLEEKSAETEGHCRRLTTDSVHGALKFSATRAAAEEDPTKLYQQKRCKERRTGKDKHNRNSSENTHTQVLAKVPI